HHFNISHLGGGTALTCEPTYVTITAHPTAHVGTVVPGAGTSITLSTGSAASYWSAASSGTLVDNGGGNARYSFDGASNSVTLALSHTVPTAGTPLNINISGAASEFTTKPPDEDPDIEFHEAGFRFLDAANNPVIATQTAAQTSAAHFLQAVRTDTAT